MAQTSQRAEMEKQWGWRDSEIARCSHSVSPVPMFHLIPYPSSFPFLSPFPSPSPSLFPSNSCFDDIVQCHGCHETNSGAVRQTTYGQ